MKRRAVLIGAAMCCTGARGKGRPLLVVGGKIGRTNAGREYHFSEAEFLELPSDTITTATVWTPRSRWEGPRLATVMAYVRANPSSELRITAIDDYMINIPWNDMERWGILLAHTQNSQRLERKRWGPLFLIYPRDDHPRELDTPMTEAKFIWQVTRVDVT
jgi:hypothetical protein